MESMIGLVIVIGTIAGLIYFRKTIKAASDYTEDVIATNVAEEKKDLIDRSMIAMQELQDAYPDGFLTPQQILQLMNNKARKVNKKTANP